MAAACNEEYGAWPQLIGQRVARLTHAPRRNARSRESWLVQPSLGPSNLAPASSSTDREEPDGEGAHTHETGSMAVGPARHPRD